MERSIQDVARLAGTTSRTLRHYAELGLLAPSRIGGNGYRYYDEAALAVLQRILLLRELGLGLPAIGEVLRGERDNVRALMAHRELLRNEKERLDRLIGSVETTIRKLEKGEQLMAEEMFDGFDHTQYREEVEQRWGKDAYASSDSWWRSLSQEQKAEWMGRQKQLGADWIAAAERGIPASSEEAQALAQRHFDWLAGIPGTPGSDRGGPTKEYFIGLAEMYVADERFARNYGGRHGAGFVRDAMIHYADERL